MTFMTLGKVKGEREERLKIGERGRIERALERIEEWKSGGRREESVHPIPLGGRERREWPHHLWAVAQLTEDGGHISSCTQSEGVLYQRAEGEAEGEKRGERNREPGSMCACEYVCIGMRECEYV